MFTFITKSQAFFVNYKEKQKKNGASKITDVISLAKCNSIFDRSIK